MVFSQYAEQFLQLNDDIPLWESVYIGEKDVLLNSQTLAVLKVYESCGLKVIGSQLGDHIGIECEFIAWLNSDLSNHIVNKKAIREQFLEAHLCPLVEEIAKVAPKKHLVHQLLNDLSGTYSDIEEGFSLKSFEMIPVLDSCEKVVITAGTNNCGGRCLIKAKVQDGCILSLDTDKGEMTGSDLAYRACTRGRNYRFSFLHPKRLKYPMKRVGKRGLGQFERISWDEATDIIAKELIRIKKQYGPESRYVQYATGLSGTLSGENMPKRLLALDGGFLDNYNDYSTACITEATKYTYGTEKSGTEMSQLEHSKLIILWGHNPAETVFGSLTNQYLVAAKRNGTKIIVVDPRYSDTAKGIGNQWIALRPGTDSALLSAMAYVIISRDLHDKEFLEKYCIGFDKTTMPEAYQDFESVEDYIMGAIDGIPKTPQWASEICGLDASEIEQFAIEYATTKPAALIQGYGAQRHENGEQGARSAMLLACLTGNVGIAGGSAAGKGAISKASGPCFPMGENPYKGSIPVFMWSKAITEGRQMTAKNDRVRGVEQLQQNIKCIINLGGNTLINQHSDINGTKALLADESLVEFIVCSDLFMTPSTMYADILLPGTSMFETDNMITSWSNSNAIFSVHQAIKPLFECRFEYDWLCEVADKMGVGESFKAGHQNSLEWLEDIYNQLRETEKELPEFSVFRQKGGYHYQEKETYIAFEKQIKNIEKYPFETPSGKIELFSESLHQLEDQKIPAIPKYMPCEDGVGSERMKKYPLQLIAWHSKRRCHSCYEDNKRLEKLEKHCLWINPEDAFKRGINTGDWVKIFNDQGVSKITVLVTDRIIKGVVAMPQGAFYTPDKNGVDTRGSINVLTSYKPTPLAKGNPQHTNLVEIEKWKEDI